MLVVKRKLQNKIGNGEVPQQRNNRSAWTLAEQGTWNKCPRHYAQIVRKNQMQSLGYW